MKINIFYKKRKIISCFLIKMTKNRKKIEYYQSLFQIMRSKKGHFKESYCIFFPKFVLSKKRHLIKKSTTCKTFFFIKKKHLIKKKSIKNKAYLVYSTTLHRKLAHPLRAGVVKKAKMVFTITYIEGFLVLFLNLVKITPEQSI